VAGGFTPPFRGPEAESWRPHVERATRELFPGVPAINVLRDPGMTRQVEDLAALYHKATSRTNNDEPGFQQWYAGHAKKLGLASNPDDPQHKYDYRAAYRAGAAPGPDGHWPSQFKADDHPNRFINGVDTKVSSPKAGPLNPQKTNLSPEDIAAMDKIVLGQGDVAKMDKIVNAPKGALNPIPTGAVPGSPGTNPDAPSWALPFAGQPPMSLREGGARVAGGLGAAATGGIAGPLGAAARVGVGAGAGAIRDGGEGALEQGLINAIIEGGAPALGALMRILPGVRNALPTRPAQTTFRDQWSHSPWAGTSQQLPMAPGPTPSPILNPAGQPARMIPPSGPHPQPTHVGPVTHSGTSTTIPARPYMPNLSPMLRALLEAAANSSRGQRADEP
jgi:hypothetical protein